MGSRLKEKAIMDSQKTIWINSIISRPRVMIPFFLILTLSLFFPLLSRINDGAFILLNLLPLVAGWLLGMRWGLLYGLLHCSTMMFLGRTAGRDLAELFENGIPAMLACLLFAGILGKMSDLTKKLKHELKERKLFQNELQHYKDQLEELVVERTEELTRSNVLLREEIIEREKIETEKLLLQATLKRAEKMEAVGILAGSVAHDLNNILTGILSYPELLLLDIPEDSPLRDPILTIQKSGERAAAVVQDLLTLARRGIINTEAINFNDIISDFLISPEYLKLNLYYSNIEIKTKLQPNLPNCIGSPVHLSKVILNLMINAMEAMKKGGQIILSTENIHIEIPTGHFDMIPPGEYVAMRISDSGEGIPKKYLDRIFEPFYSKKIMGKSGTGLGLAIVWGTVKDHTGFIDVQSTEGKGTAFTLYFPTTRDEIPIKEPELEINAYKGDGQSILVIDDTKLQREVCTKMLEKLGYNVSSVSSGENAIDYLKTNCVDLLILDMIMTGMDGLETYKRIIDIHPGQKAVIASGYTESEQVKEAQKLGAGMYIKKPYTLEIIGMAVKNELSINT